jgi:acetyl-CoA carboxylase biotin carboxyl carrier protein
MALTDEDVREILRIIDESELDELRIDMPGFRLHVRRGGAPPPADAAARAAAGAERPAAGGAEGPAAGGAEPPAAGAGAAAGEPAVAGEPAAAGAPAAREPADHPEPAGPEPSAASANGATTIDAPMLGTFYRASAPGERPFVDVGSKVDPDTVVCLIEVMKMMNSVKAGVAGTVVEVCATNAELVEHGEPLFRVATQA